MSRKVECFYPGRSFPAVSVTGSECAFDCKHCSKKYLHGMIPATTPDELRSVADALAERGARGFLLSGGMDASGKVPLEEFIPTIELIKEETDLTINAHIGLAAAEEIERLVASGIDAFSVDVYGSDETVREVLGARARAEDYLGVVERLKNLGATRIAPHVCIGIHGGMLRGEFAAIEELRKLDTNILVLIGLIPTKGTAYADARAPDADAIASVIRKARGELPDAKLLLGCMRSKRDRQSEAALVEAGLDGIVLPSPRTVETLAEMGYSVKKRASCCALI